MANEEHLAILRQGGEVWNQWRKDKLGITPDLSTADLSYAGLRQADLSEAYLSQANLTETRVGWTVFVNVDLSEVKGLESIKHGGPSSIGIDTITKSQGKI